MRVLLALSPLLFLASCYAPRYEGLACGPGNSCPGGYQCGADNRCSVDPTGPGGDGPDAPPGTDTTAPATTITARPLEFDTQLRPTFEFGCDEADCTYECRLDSTVFESCVGSYIPPSLPEGEHTFEVRATDAAGNLESPPQFVRWNVDVTAPAVAIASKPSPISGATVSFTFEANEPVTGYECNLEPGDAGAFAPCTSPKEHTGLANGNYTFSVRATDRAGQVSESISYAWTVDTSAFSASFLASPPPLSERNVTFELGSNRPGATFECSLDPAGPPVYAACNQLVTFNNLAAGAHTFYARAEFPAGTYSNPVSQTWTVDATGPTVTINGIGQGSWSNRETESFTLSCNEPPCSFECRRDGSAFSAAPNGVCAIGGLGNGFHSIEARATDARNNVGGSVVRGWQTDRTPPAAGVIDPWPKEVNCHSAPTLTLEYGAFDNESGLAWYQCRLIKDSVIVYNAQCLEADHIALSALAQGSDYDFTVTVTDMAGNTAGASIGWIQRSGITCAQL
jgi:large repetitive protein